MDTRKMGYWAGRSAVYQTKSFGAPQEAINRALQFKWTAKAMWKRFGTELERDYLLMTWNNCQPLQIQLHCKARCL
jgi:hypothetical protein